MAHSSEIEKLERRCKENPQGTFFAPLAEAYRKDRQVERALEVLRTGLERHPNHIPGNIVLGRCHLDLGEDEAAETAFRRVLELDRENVIALKALADITERRMRYDEAEQWVRSLLEVDRTNEEARVQLSRLELMRAQTMTPRPPAPEPLLDPAREQAIAEAFGEGLPPAGEPQADAVPMGGVVDGFEATAIRLDPIDDPASSVDRPAASETQAGEFPGAGMPEPSVAPEADEHAREPVELLDVVGEELVLHPSGGSEFQQPNDAETLSVGRAVDGELGADFPDAPGLASVDPEPSAPVPGSGLAAADAPGAGGADSMAPPEWPSDEPATLWNVLAQGASPAGRPSTDELMASGEALAAGAEPSASEAAAESVASVTAGTATPEAAPAEPPAGSPALAPPADRETDVFASGEPELVVTETMAELYLRQGHRDEALRVYRELASRRPGDARLREIVAGLEAEAAERVGSAPALAASAPGGRSVREFFRALVAARPAALDPPPAPASAVEPAPSFAPLGEEPGGPAESAELPGAPTRPAQDPLSLSAIFGDEPSPVPPAVVPPAPVRRDDPSFEEFFGELPAPTEAGGESLPPVRPRAPADDEDLDQFHNWLRSLKR